MRFNMPIDTGPQPGLTDSYVRRCAKAQCRQCARLAALDRRAQRVLHDPAALWRGTLQPAAGGVGQQGGVVFANVVQVVGYRAAHVQGRVVFELLQQGQHRGRVTLESG